MKTSFLSALVGFSLCCSSLSAATALIEASDYGALPDDGVDDTVGLANACNAAEQAVAGGGYADATIHFLAGIYNFNGSAICERSPKYPYAAGGYRKSAIPCHVSLLNLHHIKLNGLSGTTFVFSNPAVNGLVMSDCVDVTLRLITIDYNPRPYTQGTVTAVDPAGKSVDIQIESGYQMPTSGIFDPVNGVYAGSRDFVYIFQSKSRRDPTVSEHLMYDALPTSLGNGTYRFTFVNSRSKGGDDDVSPITVGKFAAIVPRIQKHAVVIYTSKDCTFSTTKILSSPGMGLLQFTGGRMTFTNCRVDRATLNDLVSTNMDGLHFANCNPGPILSNCNIFYTADDSIALATRASKIVQIGVEASTGHTWIDLQSPPTAEDMNVGDRVHFGKNSGEDINVPDADPTIASIVMLPPPGTPTYRVTFTTTFSGVAVGDWAKGLGGQCQGFLIDGCAIRDNRARSIICNADTGTISNNTLSRAGSSGIYLLSLPGNDTFMHARNITIQNNTIEYMCRASSICVWSGRFSNLPVTDAAVDSLLGHQNITIMNNLIRGAGKRSPIILIDNARNVTISGNTFESLSSNDPNSLAVPGIVEAMLDGFALVPDEVHACIGLDLAKEISIANSNVRSTEVENASPTPYSRVSRTTKSETFCAGDVDNNW